MMRALAYPDLYNAYLDALLDCVRSAAETAEGVTNGPGWLEREVQREYQQIRDSVLADPSKPFTNDEFERAANDLGVIARHRGDFVTAAVSAARARQAITIAGGSGRQMLAGTRALDR
jgi:LPS sulfotransferase NodH